MRPREAKEVPKSRTLQGYLGKWFTKGGSQEEKEGRSRGQGQSLSGGGFP